MPRRILYVAPIAPGQTSLYRYRALQRLGHDVIAFDVARYALKNRYLRALAYRRPVGPLVSRANADLIEAVRREKPDLVWYDRPVIFTRSTALRIRGMVEQTVCYNQDAPWGPRNDRCWYQLLRILDLIDLHCVFRKADVKRFQDRGLAYIETQFSYHPEMNFPPPEGWSDNHRTRDVSYIGSPYERRAEFLRELVDLHKLPVTISGPNWHRVLGPAECSQYIREGYLADDTYREAIWKSKINLSFVTSSNEDDVAHKAFEITACGQFLLAVRCLGHQQCFEEGKEAEFFSSVDECADKIRHYLAHPAEREQIAWNGYLRAKRSPYDNDAQLARVLVRLDEMRQHSAGSALDLSAAAVPC